jgi:serine/threonine protein kinase
MTKPSDLPLLKVGDRIGPDLTVLGVMDKYRRNPVYIVWHHRSWCPMACKTFRSRQLAEREAKALSQLWHPNTVRFLGIDTAWPAHILMEFLEGPTLGALIDSQERWLSVSDALRIAIHVGAALSHVHDRGLLHLDVKPNNVIVARGGRPVLFDFGVARVQGAARPREIFGTDAYIAPEECLRQEVTPAADVFGLGVTLYEMLTGEMPFTGRSPRNRFPQIRQSPVPIRRHRAAVPAPLDDLVLACLAREAADRPPIPVLLPALHEFIRSGPAMWPKGFRPGAASGAPDRAPKTIGRRRSSRQGMQPTIQHPAIAETLMT